MGKTSYPPPSGIIRPLPRFDAPVFPLVGQSHQLPGGSTPLKTQPLFHRADRTAENAPPFTLGSGGHTFFCHYVRQREILYSFLDDNQKGGAPMSRIIPTGVNGAMVACGDNCACTDGKNR